MAVQLRKLDEQVVVITGATSGIGLTTTRKAAEAGARLVLAARNGDALSQLASELRRKGSQVVTVTADVGVPAEVENIGTTAMERFGRIDTWINNAGVSIFGRYEDTPLEDMQRLFQTNYWGVVHGSLEAVKHMKGGDGGAIINLGSELSERSVPLQGMYSASKHAVKAFTDAPISVTLIKPAAIDTMFTVHARNYMDKEPALPPPIYAPEVPADAILYAAQHQKREVFVGGAAKGISSGSFAMPRVMDRFMEKSMFDQQQSELPSAPGRRDALYKTDPENALRQRQGMPNHVLESSAYTAVTLRSHKIAPVVLGIGALFAAWTLARRPALRKFF
jgi:short-subunit dehydrogenase